MKIGNTDISILKAGNGDSIYLETLNGKGEKFNILIDGGTALAYPLGLMKKIKGISVLNLLVLTHIDSDHISGIIKLLKSRLGKDLEVNEYWINCPNLIRIQSGEKISFNNGISLEKFLIDEKEDINKIKEIVFVTSRKEINSGIYLTVLSPTRKILDEFFKDWPSIILPELEKENEVTEVKISNTEPPSQVPKGKMLDLALHSFTPKKKIKDDLANASSISFLLETIDCSILLLADSRAEIILESLQELGYCESNKLCVDYVKISHHGSINNTSCELLDLIDCDNFIISTNGGSKKNRHPDREVISRIVYHPKRNLKKLRTIFFNYPLSTIEQKAGVIFDDADLKEGNWIVKEL